MSIVRYLNNILHPAYGKVFFYFRLTNACNLYFDLVSVSLNLFICYVTYFIRDAGSLFPYRNLMLLFFSKKKIIKNRLYIGSLRRPPLIRYTQSCANIASVHEAIRCITSLTNDPTNHLVLRASVRAKLGPLLCHNRSHKKRTFTARSPIVDVVTYAWFTDDFRR